MCSRILVLAAALILAPLGAAGRRPRRVVGRGLQRPGGRGGQGDRRGLRAEDRQAGRARLPSRAGACPTRSWRRSRPASRPISSSASSDIGHDDQWAYEGRLVDLTDAVGHFADLFDPDALDARHPARRDDRPARPVPAADGVHNPPRPRLEEPAGAGRLHARRHPEASGKRFGRSGATGCSRPCARRWAATTSGASACHVGRTRTIRRTGSTSSWDAYEADYVTRDGRLVIDDPEVRRRLIKAIDGYTAIYRKGCTPPDSVTWDQCRQQQGVPGADHRDDGEPDALDPERAQGHAARGLLRERRDDRVARRRLRPAARHRRPSSIAPRSSRTVATSTRQGVRALSGRRGLARPLSRLRRRSHAAADAEAASGAVLAGPRRPAPDALGHAASDPAARPTTTMLAFDLRHGRSGQEAVWPKAVHRVVTEGISPEQAVDEAIARIKQILSE